MRFEVCGSGFEVLGLRLMVVLAVVAVASVAPSILGESDSSSDMEVEEDESNLE